MTTAAYDAIVVGARCAGSPTALLLARQGHKVLLLDRDHFPSDTISTHLVHPPGIALLQRWGLLDRLIATGCPAIERYSHDFGPFAIPGEVTYFLRQRLTVRGASSLPLGRRLAPRERERARDQASGRAPLGEPRAGTK